MFYTVFWSLQIYPFLVPFPRKYLGRKYKKRRKDTTAFSQALTPELF